MRAAFFTLGCKVNQYETSILEQQFSADGFDIVDLSEEADVYILNSCTVTAESDKKGRQMLRRLRRQNPSAVICLCGCFPQAFPDAAKQLPEADIIAGASNRAALLSLVKRRLAHGKDSGQLIDIAPHTRGESFEPMGLRQFSAHTRAFVKIEDGCERYCTYCVIPRARGTVRSKPLEDLCAEVSALAENGFEEIVLVGINLSSYGKDLGLRLVDAVKCCCDDPKVLRVRLGSLEPELLTKEDIAIMASLPKLCPQFHLSLQSGCNTTLGRMGRQYTASEYGEIVTGIRDAFENPAITTDIMVGFPDESEEEFAASLAFVKETGFARAHVFAYSKREGTPAAKMDGQVPEAEKLRRSKIMLEATAKSCRDFLLTQKGRTLKVLFETKNDDFTEGYSENYSPVRVYSVEDLAGQIRDVFITGTDVGHLIGELR